MSVAVHQGDCLEVMRSLPDASVDAVVTDPPYDLTARKRGGPGVASAGGFMGKAWDGTGIAFRPDVWAECLRVLKPGGHLLAFGGTRTWHRLAVAVEDAGFELRDSIAWLYGSGFPKSLDVSKAIDKAAGAEREVVGINPRAAQQTAKLDATSYGAFAGTSSDLTAPATPDAERWQGWGTALKPAFEPIVVARKPLTCTVAANVLEHGTGALNIAATRVTSGDNLVRPAIVRHNNDVLGKGLGAGVQTNPAGRWPTNVVLDGHAADALDQQSGESKSPKPYTRNAMGGEYFGYTVGGAAQYGSAEANYGDQGGASRFFKVISPTFRYQAKAPARERPKVDGVAHPTVKPLELMRWLVRLVTPPGGVVLDPFAGSGATVEAALLEGFACIAIEREADYLPLIQVRIDRQQQPCQGAARGSCA